jgi:hypothetical protein
MTSRRPAMRNGNGRSPCDFFSAGGSLEPNVSASAISWTSTMKTQTAMSHGSLTCWTASQKGTPMHDPSGPDWYAAEVAAADGVCRHPTCRCKSGVSERVAEQHAVHEDLAQLLRILGLGDHARPQSPHEVMLDAINEAGRLRAALARHQQSFNDHRGVRVCGGCLSDWPCPDAREGNPDAIRNC